MPLPHKRLFLIPLDARPVCYDFPKRLAQSAGLELCLPSPTLLGYLKQPANLKALERWIKQHLFEKEPVIAALDTLAYGGLIPARLDDNTLTTLKQRIDRFIRQVDADGLFAFSSILRIPAYNNAEEEPDYWAQYGAGIYNYSASVHQHGEDHPKTQALALALPADVLNDFLARRKRHHSLNRHYLQYLSDRQFDYLTFCQDDTGPFGINVQEAQDLAREVHAKHLDQSAHIQTGADEIAVVMLARWMARVHTAQNREPVRIYPYFSSETGRQCIARFDGISIEAIADQAIRACGAQRAKKPKDADLWLVVHTPDSEQGDLCLPRKARVSDQQHDAVLGILETAIEESQPVMLADVANANGSDALLSEKILTRFEDLTPLYGYAAWNTPGNTLGSCVAMGVVRYLAEYYETFQAEEFCKLLLIRLGDDWLYQSEVRQKLRAELNGTLPDEIRLNTEMANGLALLKSRLGLDRAITHCAFPCQRTFEVEITVQ